jgi:hypothetical protein
MKLRISKQLKDKFPPSVVHQIQIIADDHNIKSFNLEEVSESKSFFVAEGDSYTGIGPDGKTASFEVVSEHNIGAAGLSHKIGEQFKMPAGSYLLNVWYYDKYYLTVYRICSKLLN